jgi:hypothetical protein
LRLCEQGLWSGFGLYLRSESAAMLLRITSIISSLDSDGRSLKQHSQQSSGRSLQPMLLVKFSRDHGPV